MLEHLIENKNAERILLFLLVNQRCYVNQIQRAFQISLIPIQSMMNKFQRDGIVTFERLGKTKFYYFHPNYPLLHELKTLLQKTFTYLPSNEKNLLFSRQGEWLTRSFNHKKRISLSLSSFWRRLVSIQKVTILTQSNGKAYGNVQVKEEKRGTLLFTERGKWESLSQGIEFHNILRWTFDFENGLVGLEHLRHGQNYPVFIFHLAPASPRCLQSIDSHLCRDDCYFGQIDFDKQKIQFTWRILGPRKNETLHSIYSTF